MRASVCLLLICAVLVGISGVLGAPTLAEKNALRKILAAYPQLAYTLNSLQHRVGWKQSFSGLCTTLEYASIRCSKTGHIEGLEFTSSQLESNTAAVSLSDLSGLTYLKTLYIKSGTPVALIEALFRDTHLEVVELPSYIEAYAPHFSNLKHLKNLLVHSHSGPFPDLTASSGSLVQLSISTANPISLDALLPYNLSLTNLELIFTVTHELSMLPIQHFVQLASLSLGSTTGDLTLVDFTELPENLERLQLTQLTIFPLAIDVIQLHPHLKELIMTSVDDVSFTTWPIELTELHVNSMTNMTLPTTSSVNLTSLSLMYVTPKVLFPLIMVPSLKKFRVGPPYNSSDLKDEFQLKDSSVESLHLSYTGTGLVALDGALPATLQELEIVGDPSYSEFPSSFSSLPLKRIFLSSLELDILSVANLPATLEHLQIRCNYNAVPSATPFSHLTQLVTLKIAGTITTPEHEFPSDILELDQLEELELVSVGVHGLLPPTFFVDLPKLRSLSLIYNFLVGTIPHTSMDSLETLNVYGNGFIAFPNPIPSSNLNLTSVTLIDNPLQLIPDDLVLLSMTKLSIWNCANTLLTSFPLFWASHPRLTSVYITDHPMMSGKIPSLISAPYLTTIYLSNNHLEGRLPDFDSGASRVIYMDLANNELEGSIPISWGNVAFASLQLQQNNLSGCILPQSISLGTYNSLTELDLSFNDFNGLVPNLAPMPRLSSLHLQSNRFELCQSDPGIPIQVVLCNVSMQTLTFSTDCNDWYDDCDFYPITMSSTPAATCQSAVQTLPTCSTPPPSIEFDCVNGQWVATESIETQTLTLSTPALQINGNLTVLGDLTVLGFKSNLFVNGCIFLSPDTEIEYKLSEEDWEYLKQHRTQQVTVITTNGGDACSNVGSTDLSTISVKADGDSKRCEKVKAKNSGTRDSMVVTFQLDRSKCNLWWIILASVLGGVILLIIIVALIVTFVPGAKKAIRPFSKRDVRG